MATATASSGKTLRAAATDCRRQYAIQRNKGNAAMGLGWWLFVASFCSAHSRERLLFPSFMKLLPAPNLTNSLRLDGEPLDNAALIADRQTLVDQFNAAVGSPGEGIEEMQRDFINGKMPYQEWCLMFVFVNA